MLKDELNQRQLKNRNIFITKITNAGWDPRGWEQLFESGINLSPEAQAEYQNDTFNLRLCYYIEEGYILLECFDKDEAVERNFRFYFNVVT